MIRKEIYNIEYVLSKIKIGTKRESEVDFDGDLIFMNSERYHVFNEKGIICVCCGLEAKYFAKERNGNNMRYHFNLYGIDENGKEILFTKDHIIPKSKGGPGCLVNYQTMCLKCNGEKSNKY